MFPSSAGFGFKQILQGLLGFALLIVLVWLAFYALIVLFAVLVCVVTYVFARRWLIAKGIIKPSSSETYSQSYTSSTTIIEAEYKDVSAKDNHESR